MAQRCKGWSNEWCLRKHLGQLELGEARGSSPEGASDVELRARTLVFHSWFFIVRDHISVTVFKLLILIDK